MNERRSRSSASGATLAWLLLVCATGVGWWLGHTAQGPHPGVNLAVAGVIITAFLKVWIVGYQFMELRYAPKWLRRGFDAWIVVVVAVLLLLCYNPGLLSG